MAAPLQLSAGLLTAVLQELTELQAAVDVDTEREYVGASSTDAAPHPLRAVMLHEAGRVGHELSRFALVFRADESTPDGVAETVRLILTACTSLVSAVQLFTKPCDCGPTLRDVVRHTTHSILGSVTHVLKPIAAAAVDVSRGAVAPPAGAPSGSNARDADSPFTASQLVSVRVRCSTALLPRVGMAIKACDAFQGLPTSDHAAVRRKLLACGKLIKSSVDEISSDQGIEVDTARYTLPALPGPDELALPLAASTAAASAAATTAASHGDDEGEDDDEEARDAVACHVPAFVAVRIATFGIAALRLSMRAVKGAIAALDDVCSTGEAARVYGVTRGVAIAAGTLNDGIIDFAAAVNDLEASDITEACNTYTRSLLQLRDACGRLAGSEASSVSASASAAASSGSAASPATQAAFADVCTAVDAAAPYVGAVLRSWNEYSRGAAAAEEGAS